MRSKSPQKPRPPKGAPPSANDNSDSKPADKSKGGGPAVSETVSQRYSLFNLFFCLVVIPLCLFDRPGCTHARAYVKTVDKEPVQRSVERTDDAIKAAIPARLRQLNQQVADRR